MLLDEHRDMLTDPQTVQFGIWYHDVVYNVLTKTSELESAKLARQHLFAMGLPAEKINRCFDMIVATKTHQLPPQVDDMDGRFFMDIDLSILGADMELYLEYAEQVRNEYKVFPSFLYRRGRKKALLHLLDTPSIYKTDLFRAINWKHRRVPIWKWSWHTCNIPDTQRQQGYVVKLQLGISTLSGLAPRSFRSIPNIPQVYPVQW